MDRALTVFRKAAAAENGDRTGLRRRYSAAVRHHAITYWQQQRRRGVGVRRVAADLGVAPWSLHRWIRAATSPAAFHAVTVVPSAAPSAAAPTVTLRITADGPHIEGLDLESAARLLRLLR
jgi:hypothetical protein